MCSVKYITCQRNTPKMVPLHCALNLLSERSELMGWKSKSGPRKVSLRLDSRTKCNRVAFNKVTWKMASIRFGQPGVPLPSGEQCLSIAPLEKAWGVVV